MDNSPGMSQVRAEEHLASLGEAGPPAGEPEFWANVPAREGQRGKSGRSRLLGVRQTCWKA